jgi:hypothetical protein
MYWSGCQSTGAEMRKYLTARRLADAKAGGCAARDRGATGAEDGIVGGTYDCRPAAAQRCCPAVGFAGRPDLIRKSPGRPTATEAAASHHEC